MSMANAKITVGFKICFWVLPLLWVQTIFWKAWIWATNAENIEIELVQKTCKTNKTKSKIAFWVWFIGVRLKKVE